MGGLAISVVLAALFESAGATAASHELYDNVVPADTAECLAKVQKKGSGRLHRKNRKFVRCALFACMHALLDCPHTRQV